MVVLGYLGIVMACGTMQADTCVLTSSPTVFSTEDECVSQAEAVVQGYLDSGYFSYGYCVQVRDAPKGEML